MSHLDIHRNFKLLTEMLYIRMVEESLAERYHEQEMRCPMHLCIGQEAIAAGVSSSLLKSDYVFSGHRAHGHYLAKGGDLGRMFAELYGRDSGCCSGRGGSMHLIDTEAGFMGSTAIVGGTIPIAVGSAWAAKLKSENRVTVVYFGDGCFEEGVVHESLNFASLHALPIVFVCENNQYSVFTSLRQRQPNRPIHKVARAHGIATIHGNGNDVFEVADAAKHAIHQAREHFTPQFLEFSTHRWPEHCGPNYDDHLGYREPGELQRWMDKCPIKTAHSKLVALGEFNENLLLKAKERIENQIEAAFDFATSAPPSPAQNLEESIYGS